jgi:hypothetical protein
LKYFYYLCESFVNQFVDNNYAHGKTHITTTEPCLRCRASDQRKRPAQATSASDFLAAPNYYINLQRCSCSMRSMNNVFYHVPSLITKTMKNIFSMGGQPVVPAQTKTIGNTMNIAAIKLIAYIVLCCISINAHAVPFTFEYGKIPFGKPMAEVLALVEGAEIEEDKESRFACGDDGYGGYISSYLGIDNYFSGGLFVITGLPSNAGTFFLSSITKSFIVRSKEWDNIGEIRLFFVKDKSDYILWMVAKLQNNTKGNYSDVFKNYEKNITQKLGIQSKKYDTKWETTFVGQYSWALAKAAEWTTKSYKIFLMVKEGLFRSGTPIILYIDINGKNKYMNGVKQYEILQQQEIEQQNKPSF